MAHDELVKRLLWHVEQTIGPVSDEPIVNEHDSDKAVLLFNFYAETKRAIDYWYRQGKDDQHQTDADHIEKLEADKALLREALGEIWEWIGNWSPDFIWDDEWPATEAKARAALQETIHDRD